MLSVSVVIPAYREEKNIRAILEDVCSQKTQSFSLKEIVVIADGSPETVAEGSKILDDRLKITNYSSRHGKAYLLNMFHPTCTSDITVLLDADIRLSHSGVLEALIAPFQKDPNLAATCGQSIHIDPKTRVESIAAAGIDMLEKTKQDLGEKALRYRFNGKILAIRTQALAGLVIPGDVATDTFTFYYLISKSHKITFIPQAEVFYKLPQKMSEYINQTKRYLKTNCHRYFDRKLLKQYETITFSQKFRALVRYGQHQPVLSLSFGCVYCIAKFRSFFYTRRAKWDMSETTKFSFNVAKKTSFERA
ncbi:MAG: hypothetical protein K0S38_1044 [Candidatus Paceibacter sp.]|jgi:cellulose synthase/poly-beta-1,6-N-acetylglucosamine synthase-like glycosyltransferase|nr:hypothetical protein [Candidatus Paceibacter sp.]